MVPNLIKGRGIKGTALYVLHDVRDEAERAIGEALTPEHQTAHRVGHIETRNLSTDDPALAWRLMCATAAQRDQLKQAAGVHKGGREAKYHCGHLSLSWEHGTKPDGAQIGRAAEGALKALGWEKLQALIVEHRDHDHAHCHIVVNLVCPETGRIAPNAKDDFKKLQRWAYSYEKERGQIVCDRRAERIEAAQREVTQREAAPERRRWLPRKEWEAQQAAKRQAAVNARREQQEETRRHIRTSAAGLREQHRPEWGELYKRHRTELRGLEQRERAQVRKLQWAINKPVARAAMLRDYQAASPIPAPAPKPKGWMGATVSPQHLTAVVVRACRVERAQLAERQAAEKAALVAKVEEARHVAQRAIWQAHAERVAAARPPQPASAPQQVAHPQVPSGPARRGMTTATFFGGLAAIGMAALAAKPRQSAQPAPTPEPQREPAAPVPQPVRQSTPQRVQPAPMPAEPSKALPSAYERAMAGHDERAADRTAKSSDPPRRDPPVKSSADPQPAPGGGGMPANTNQRDDNWAARYAAARRREREHNRHRGRERDR